MASQVQPSRIIDEAIAIGHIRCPKNWRGRTVKDMSCCCLVGPLKIAMQASKDSFELKKAPEDIYKNDLLIIVKAIEKEKLLVCGVQLAALISIIFVVVVLVTWLFASVPDSTINGLGVAAGLPLLGGATLHIYKSFACTKGPSQAAADRIANSMHAEIAAIEK